MMLNAFSLQNGGLSNLRELFVFGHGNRKAVAIVYMNMTCTSELPTERRSAVRRKYSADPEFLDDSDFAVLRVRA